MLTMYHPRTRWKRAALGSLALFSGVLGTLLRRASGEISNCQDLLTPAYQSDWNSGLVPLGPALDTGFFDTANDALRVRVMTSPGIGTTDKSAFTRTLEIVLSGPDAISFDGAATAVSSGCWTSWPRFSLQFPPPNIAVLSTTVMISNEISANCSFYHVLSMPWQAFTSSGLAYCGFQAGDLVNGMRNFSGRVHVRWSDFDQLDSTMPIYGPNEMFYDARLGISELGQASAGPVLVLAPTMTSTLTRTRSKTKSSTTQSVTKTVSLTTTATTTDVDFSSTSFTRTTKTTVGKRGTDESASQLELT